MFEDDFSKMLRDYPAAVTDKKVFAGLMKDLFPGQQMQINLMNTTYELGIANEIAGVAHINNAFAFRFVKRLVDEYGVSRLNADWAVSVWCVCYGQRLLHKPCDIQISRAKAVQLRQFRQTAIRTQAGNMGTCSAIQRWTEAMVSPDFLVKTRKPSFSRTDITTRL